MQETCDILLDASAIQQVFIFKKNNPQWEKHSLRVYIAGKGCDGFNYGVTFDESKEEDHRFMQKDADGNAVEVVIDPETFKFVRSSRITWVDDDRGRGFLVENPKHKQFRGKFFKRAGWEQRILD